MSPRLFAPVFRPFQKRSSKPGQASALGLKLSNLSLRLIVLAPSNIVDSYLKWRLLATSGVVNPEEIMEAFAEIIVEMRKDVTGEFGDVNTVLDALA